MTEVTATLRRVRIAPRKLRLVADAVKGREVGDAETTLRYAVKRGAGPLLKLLKSAIANARHNAKVAEGSPLVIRDIRVDEGPVFKRYMPRARGRAAMIKKRTSHVFLVLESK